MFIGYDLVLFNNFKSLKTRFSICSYDRSNGNAVTPDVINKILYPQRTTSFIGLELFDWLVDLRDSVQIIACYCIDKYWYCVLRAKLSGLISFINNVCEI